MPQPLRDFGVGWGDERYTEKGSVLAGESYLSLGILLKKLPGSEPRVLLSG
jgi:hypothetical protein